MNKKALAYLSFVYLTSFTFFSCLVPPGKEPEVPEPVEIFSPVFDEAAYTIPPNHDFDPTVAHWFGFKNAAASLTFDDGTYDQFAHAMPILEEAGVKGSFYLAADLIEKGMWDDRGTMRKMMSWDDAAILAGKGHEIGSHSLNHIDLSREDTDLFIELGESRLLIEKRLPGVAVETFCWPHWRETPAALRRAADFYISARSGNGIISYYLNRKGGIPSDPPESMFAVNALGILKSQSREEWTGVADKVFQSGSWFVTSYHGVDREGSDPVNLGWSALPEEMFRDTINYVKEKGFWIDTFAAVSKYIYERDASVLHVNSSGNSVSLRLDDGLDDSIYNQELTISIILPSGWTTPQAYSEEGLILESLFEKGLLFLNLIPDGRAVIIKPY